MQAGKAWRKLFGKKHLKEHYFEKIKDKPSVGMDKVSPSRFENELEENIDIINRKVLNGTYRFTRYKQLLFLKGPGKAPRTVCVPTLRDKLVASVLNELLVEIYGDECKTKLPQLIIDDIINNKKSYDCFIKLDVKSFYGSIDQEKLLKILKRRIRKKEILGLIESAIKTEAISYPIRERGQRGERKCGVPEGLPISNALANIFMSDIDTKYQKRNDLVYYRYVDDILILVNKENFESVKAEIEEDIKKKGLEFNSKKDEGLIADGFEYLGYKLYEDKVTVRLSSVLKIEQSIEELFGEIKKGNLKYIQWKLNLKITGFILEKHKYGWIFFYSQINDMNLLFHLDDVVSKLIKRYKLDGKIKVKRFVRAFSEMHYALHETKYISNLDELTHEQKRKVLSEIYGMDLSGKSDLQTEIMFRRVMRREIRDIEKDVQNIS